MSTTHVIDCPKISGDEAVYAKAAAAFEPVIFGSPLKLEIGSVVRIKATGEVFLIKREVTESESIEWCNRIGVTACDGPYYYEVETD